MIDINSTKSRETTHPLAEILCPQVINSELEPLYLQNLITNKPPRLFNLTSGMRDSNSRPLGPKPSALAIWANPRNGARGQDWTADTRLFRPLLYHWATLAYKFNTLNWMVGIGGLEPPTSSLSEMRSNQLSYMPIIIHLGDAGLELATSWSQTKHSSHLS